MGFLFIIVFLVGCSDENGKTDNTVEINDEISQGELDS